MTITYQNYLWCLNPARMAAQNRPLPQPGQQFSIFTDTYGEAVLNYADRQGEVLTEPNLMREDHFVVIDDFGSTAGVAANWVNNGVLTTNWIPNGFVNIWVDTTGYYQDPQNVSALGISGNAAPYPETEGIRPAHYMLNPPIYIEPFVTWDVRYTMMNDLKNWMTNLAEYNSGGPSRTVGICPRGGRFSAGVRIDMDKPLAQVFVQYWLFSGSDALIAEELMKLGIAVNVDNAEWFRRQLVKQEGLETETWNKYLNISKAYLDMERARQDYVG